MTLENTKIEKTEIKKSDVSNYLISGVSENSVNPKYIETMDKLFSQMQKGEKTNNSQIVKYIEATLNEEIKADIKTDIPLFGSKKTNAVSSGLVEKIKEGRIWVYIKQ